MERFVRYTSLLLILSLTAISPGWGDYHADRYSRGELNQLVGPIALYPDPLLAQILPASTFIDQIEDAAAFVRHRGSESLVDDQNWDISVRAVAHYPSVLFMMADKPDWTTALGQAYIEQPYDVMDAVQRLRAQARRLGYLYPSDRQDVIVRSGYIRIIPVQPRYIYAPRYDPQVVYVRRAPSRRDEITKDILIFGLGLLIGSWLDRDCDWDHHRVYYHGWRGGGWIGRSRSHVTINNIYVNNNYFNRPIRVNRTVINRDIRPYRHELRSSAGHFRPPASITTPAHFQRSVPSHGPRQQNQPRQLVRPTPGMIHGNMAHMKAMAAQKHGGGPVRGKMHGQPQGRVAAKAAHKGQMSLGKRSQSQRPTSHQPRNVGRRVSAHTRTNTVHRANPFAPSRAPRTVSRRVQNNRHVSMPSRPRQMGHSSTRRVQSRPASHGARVSRSNRGPQRNPGRKPSGGHRPSGNHGGGSDKHRNRH